jgi:Flp pilus assembly protein TadG
MRLPVSALPSRVARRLAKLKSDKRGIAATEFALLLPIMLVLFVGVSEVGQAISISRKVTITARTITDLVTQYSALGTSDMSNLLADATQVMTPYPSSNVTVIVSEVTLDSQGKATIDWSAAYNGTAYSKGQSVTLPGVTTPGVTVVWGQVQYRYTPVIGYKIIGTMVLQDQIYLNSRLCTKIAYTPLTSKTTPATYPSTLQSACNS